MLLTVKETTALLMMEVLATNPSLELEEMNQDLETRLDVETPSVPIVRTETYQLG